MDERLVCRRAFVVGVEEGLHMRPLSQLAGRVRQFRSEVRVSKGAVVADARSVLDLLTLDAGCGEEVVVEVVGPDATDAIESLARLFESNFTESPEAGGQDIAAG
ncbi:HPr family phosphocarrier protein [Thalassoroseus pseudoceratinae]|uniref:HPr family phosphocarrier protein n=1 Tax=Thalassoroseus pseudoceratinae TaxID=2713176 RepID=UPI0021BCF729|nr:HPr family phosphocarrier protein [Thalassoroseus pseudoceratinae]